MILKLKLYEDSTFVVHQPTLYLYIACIELYTIIIIKKLNNFMRFNSVYV